MKIRTKFGTNNVVGIRVAQLRKARGMKQRDLLAKLQVEGIDINTTGISELEGQIRVVRDYEVLVLAKLLNTSVEFLLEGRNDEQQK